ncbi:hypothetical protein SAMN05216558_0980 [Pseudomonas vancouverensis]|uniref:CDP-Glycerol:Poly(Glycerophosphate) glycerophosphotransferase n=2 Tax=Pseudomonas vancouverensis TaxID=95300 RepID=A0A1H2MM66_PSEVA|nr:hypothetical protein F7R09_18700 [Pseudomonas vancouverensis]TDB59431.1 hypothetical protein EIY72_20105 [Pseudomonas vancouverensis]SDU94323.1 hypothetical protein SAMN05216558_0980 [Pseudomonas vancouverensis]
MQNVYLISDVNNGGKTYLEYLLPALNALRDDYHCIVLQTPTTGVSQQEAQSILKCPVEEVELSFFQTLKSEIVIANDAYVARLLDDSNFCIFIAHGNVGMPLRDKYYCAELMSYWDAIVSSSRSLFDLIGTGLKLYRQDKQSGRLTSMFETSRSDLRKTSLVSLLPVKVPENFSAPPDFQRTPGEYVVGLLPTQMGICESGASLFENIADVINSVKSQIPHARFILRPYMTDFESPYVQEICEQLAPYDWITLDTTGQSSKAFYRQCDTVITDASSGGVSFMLNTCRLPVYYVPNANDGHPIVTAWLDQMGGLLPIANNGEVLKAIIGEIESLPPQAHFLMYQDFCEKEYSGLQHPDQVFLELVQQQHQSRYRYGVVGPAGDVNTGLINAAATAHE